MVNSRLEAEEQEEILPLETSPEDDHGSPLSRPSEDEPSVRSNSSSGNRNPFTRLRGGIFHRLRFLCRNLSLSEISGSFGDLGTFIPLFVALGRQRAIYVTPALFFAGLTNAITGFFWDVPMPVQPMKSISALAISGGLNRDEVTAAGIWMGIFMVSAGVTNGIEFVNRIVPASVVAGVQLGVGLSLAIHGIQMVAELPFWSAPDCVLLAIVAGIVTIYSVQQQDNSTSSATSRRLVPAIGLSLLVTALVLAVIKMFGNDTVESWSWDPIVELAIPGISKSDWMGGLLEGAIPQLPLTTLNSVISVCALAHTLFPEKRHGAPSTRDNANHGEDTDESLDAVLSRREVAFSVGIFNLLACPFGAMPTCHGAGGLAGQHKFGARHGSSIVFLGCLKMIVASTVGVAVVDIMDAFPLSILGVMLAMAGQELALTGLMLSLRNISSVGTSHTPNQSGPALMKDQIAVSLLTAIVILGTKKTHFGASPASGQATPPTNRGQP
eukprot:CAMPEP_0172472558 /NCGR_PEP_ID=MMETSP1065-20121228/68401_1 /TAXON_ID=265537 /ORGANISM="Amphiprora paludosa, Strain CCMP125" /LENGTH=496 /DNA_ID=CAMNT_0013230705 /DNA_START=87 /DNA_END=1577 /DNA_ORIENTATION=-